MMLVFFLLPPFSSRDCQRYLNLDCHRYFFGGSWLPKICLICLQERRYTPTTLRFGFIFENRKLEAFKHKWPFGFSSDLNIKTESIVFLNIKTESVGFLNLSPDSWRPLKINGLFVLFSVFNPKPENISQVFFWRKIPKIQKSSQFF